MEVIQVVYECGVGRERKHVAWTGVHVCKQHSSAHCRVMWMTWLEQRHIELKEVFFYS